MILKYAFTGLLIISFSCKENNAKIESEVLVNTKWYYYSYASELTAYDMNNRQLNPLLCNISPTLVEQSGDTTKIYFKAWYDDSQNLCSYKPLNLLGITVIQQKQYLPTYNHIVFDTLGKTAAMDRMRMYENLLKETLIKSKDSLNKWLLQEAIKRKII
ncbi:MAG TPA: hypothetical protein VD993_11845 [Chitinophagaceae bacterium]|nr:hypothetical protein [Chitinophagaceae bacterium]